MMKVIISFNTFVVYVTHIHCILSSSNWIIFGYKAVLTRLIGMMFAICGTKTVTIKICFFIMTRINVCCNVHFSISAYILKEKCDVRNYV